MSPKLLASLALRVCEKNALLMRSLQPEFDARFVGLARRVYHLNDKRASLKTSINLLCDSPIQEVKSYEEY